MQKFRLAHEGTECQHFLAVKQTVTIEEYTKIFIELATPMSELSADVLEILL